MIPGLSLSWVFSPLFPLPQFIIISFQSESRIRGKRLILGNPHGPVNRINEGLPIVTCDAVDSVENGDEVTIDFEAGTVTTPRGTYTFPPLDPSVMEILSTGGLVPYVKKKLAAK